MNRDTILRLPSMPAASPSYPLGPYRFVNREYLIVAYVSDPAAIRAAVPEPLTPVPEAVVYFPSRAQQQSTAVAKSSRRASGILIEIETTPTRSAP